MILLMMMIPMMIVSSVPFRSVRYRRWGVVGHVPHLSETYFCSIHLLAVERLPSCSANLCRDGSQLLFRFFMQLKLTTKLPKAILSCKPEHRHDIATGVRLTRYFTASMASPHTPRYRPVHHYM